MSVCHWIIEGVGIEVDKIRPHLSQEKLLDFLTAELPEDERVQEILRVRKATGECPEFNIDDYLRWNPFDGLGDLLTHCDDTDSITFTDDGDGNDYFYYPPSMPWEMRADEPKTLEECHKRIIDAVQKVTDLSAAEIDSMIVDDLYVWGMG